MSRITTTALRTRGTDGSRWLTDGGSRGTGRLAARIKPSGVYLYFQYFHGSQRRWLPLGPYDESGERGLSLIQARDRTAELSALYRSGVHDLHSHVERQQRAEEEAVKSAELAAATAAEEAKRGTLKQLLTAYTSHLEKAGKSSARDVRSIFGKHVFEASPELSGRKAIELSIDDFVGLVSRLVEVGKGRTADKLRSYLRSAFQLALESKTNPAAPIAMRTYGIQINPVASIGALSQFNRVRERVLSSVELGALISRLGSQGPGPQKDALQLLLLLGGQRPVQLLRLRAVNVDLTANTVTLFDPKGARQRPRAHVLPLVAEAKGILARRMQGLTPGEPVFSTDGKHPLRVETLGEYISGIVTTMVECDPPEAPEPFQLRDLRRTCETQMAALQISRDVRAQLQSHGLGGVQARHYDRHDYFSEKKQALQKWAKHLTKLYATQATIRVSTTVSI
jgi:integrase